jgi:hypothetical protein
MMNMTENLPSFMKGGKSRYFVCKYLRASFALGTNNFHVLVSSLILIHSDMVVVARPSL